MTKVDSANLRAYNVGFGDCVLLQLTYDDASSRNVLMDFGSTKLPDTAAPDHMEFIANNIAAEVGGKLDIVVATHRHADHISGFGDADTGPIIEALHPEVVVQPWSEDPDLPTGAEEPVGLQHPADHLALSRTLTNMHAFAAGAHAEGLRLKNLAGFPPTVAERLEFLGETNIKNKAAVKRLMKMGTKPGIYAKFGDHLDDLLPGVRIEVLGPPTLKQAPAIKRQAHTHATEFWTLAAAWGRAVEAGAATAEDLNRTLGPLFPDAVAETVPPAAEWLLPRINRVYADQMLSILRVMDRVLNNTSLILLMHIGETKLLFPGDAQIENWSYALFDAPKHAEIRERLAGTDVYKVGHHGSLNATPMTLWNGFANKRAQPQPNKSRLISLLSTKAGKHGDPRKDTEVPRQTLVAALKESTDFDTTQNRRGAKPWVDVKIPLA